MYEGSLYDRLRKGNHKGLFPQHSLEDLNEATRIVREDYRQQRYGSTENPITRANIAEAEIFAEQVLETLRLKSELKSSRRTFAKPTVYMYTVEDSSTRAAVKIVGIGKNFYRSYRYEVTYGQSPTWREETREAFFARAAELLAEAEKNPFCFFRS